MQEQTLNHFGGQTVKWNSSTLNNYRLGVVSVQIHGREEQFQDEFLKDSLRVFLMSKAYQANIFLIKKKKLFSFSTFFMYTG